MTPRHLITAAFAVVFLSPEMSGANRLPGPSLSRAGSGVRSPASSRRAVASGRHVNFTRPILAGKLPFRLVVDTDGLPVNTPNIVARDTTITCKANINGGQATASFAFSKPVRVKNGPAFMRAIPDGEKHMKGMLEKGLDEAGSQHRRAARGLMQRGLDSFLNMLPICTEGATMELTRTSEGARVLKYTAHSVLRSRIFGNRKIPQKTIEVPFALLSRHLVEDVTRMFNDNTSEIRPFMRALREDGFITEVKGGTGSPVR